MATESRGLRELIAERGESPVLVGVQDVPHDACELYRFSDGTEVIVTNAGVVAEGEDGFAEMRAEILDGEDSPEAS